MKTRFIGDLLRACEVESNLLNGYIEIRILQLFERQQETGQARHRIRSSVR